MDAPAPVKICIRCGVDCSGRPRTKDQFGHYTCRECYEKLQAQAKAAPSRALPAPKAAAPAPNAGAPAPAPPEADEPFVLADDPAGIASAVAHQPRECSNCGMLLAHDAVVCMRCGLNLQTGKLLATRKLSGEGRSCIKCGYSLAGLKTTKCPECGTVNHRKSKAEEQREQDRKTSRAVARNEYLKSSSSSSACSGSSWSPPPSPTRPRTWSSSTS